MNVLQILLAFLGLGIAVVAGATVGNIFAHRRREKRDAKRIQEAEVMGLHIPASLHPLIDPDLCSGCLSCLDVCPEGDLFGVQKGKAVFIEAAKCIGHGVCAEACPTGAISLVLGTSERGVDLPETNELFETSRPGVHIVGELGGMGLIKNALKQGLDVARYLRNALSQIQDPATGARGIEKDIAIVGAGPAGIATAVGCRALKMSFRIIDQNSVGGAIANYPRQKLVMTEPVKLPLYGTFGKSVLEKEEILEALEEVIDRAKIQVHENVKALGIDGEDGAFTIKTSEGSFTARKVVLALGRRGSPRKLNIPGEEREKVTYVLTDARQYDGKKVLVVGGGDSALEAAIMLAEQPQCETTLCYRGGMLKRGRASSRARVEELIQQGKVQLLLNANVQNIGANEVTIDVEGSSRALPNDFVIVCVGGTLPDEFLKKIDVNISRHHGEPVGGFQPALDSQNQRWVTVSLILTGVLSVAGFAAFGWDYYLLDKASRVQSPLHDILRPSGTWGHGIGIVATLMMMSNFLYSARKRWGWFSQLSLRGWMVVHTFFGLVSPGLVAFHSAFQSNNLVATATSVAVGIVVCTGLIGRFFYGLMPLSEGRIAAIGTLKDEQRRLAEEMRRYAMGSLNPRSTQMFADQATLVIPAKGSLWRLLFRMPANFFRVRKEAAGMTQMFDDLAVSEKFRTAYVRQMRLRIQIIFYRNLRRLMSVWRMMHVSLACMLVVLVLAHVAISLYLGFGWVLF